MEPISDIRWDLLTRARVQSVDTAYAAGYDCGMNGADEKNCHFTYFGTPELTKAWEAGVAEAKRCKEQA